MNSLPLTTREYAYFSISGNGTYEHVTQVLGITPSEAWNVGDINTRNGRPRKFMKWCLQSGLEDKQPLELHIQNLFLFLEPKAEAIRELWVEFDLTLVCTGHFPPSGHGMHFSREQIRKAAQLGLAFDLDFYFVDDHESST